MAPELRVLLADPDTLTRHALALLLRGKLGLSDIGEAPDGETLVRAMGERPAGLILLDWSLPGRLDCEALLAARGPHARLVILSVNPDHAAQAKALGAVFIHKASAAEQVLEQLRSLLVGPVERGRMTVSHDRHTKGDGS